MVSVNDHPEIRRVFEGFHFEQLDIYYSVTNQRQGKAAVTGELDACFAGGSVLLARL